MDALEQWREATAHQPWGVQRALLETLKAVRDEQVTLAWGRDYSVSGNPCLINAAATMLKRINGTGGSGVPSMHYQNIVAAFDKVNSLLMDKGLNNDETVSPMAAEVLVQWFAPLKEQPVIEEVKANARTEEFAQGTPYVEPTDEDLTRDWLNALSNPATCEPTFDSNVMSHNIAVEDPNNL